METDIGRADMFKGLSSSSIEEIKGSGSVRSFDKGEFVFLEGSPGDAFFILLEGRVRLSKSTEDGREVTVKSIEPPEEFAETVLFESDRYPVSAQALEPSRVFSISRGTFRRLLEKRAFRDEFISMLMKKQRYLAGRILYLTTYDVEERFFRFLLDRYGCREQYEIDAARKDIASAIGTVPETFSRLIARLKARGVLEWEGSRLVLDPGFWEGSDLA